MASQSNVWAQSMVGQTLKGQYRLEGLLGEGAMGVVFRAVNLAMGKSVAIKMMRRETYATSDALERFNREARVWSQLNHPVITQVFDFGLQNGQPFLVMELVEGADLSEVLKQEKKLEPLRAVKLIRQLAGALEEAHRMGVIHRDLKPANMKLLRYQPGGKIILKVLDFGMAKQVGKAEQRLTAPGMLVGTPKYVAPEQITENPLLDGRTDLYAVGVVFYELLTGQAPFLGSPHEVLLAHLGAEPRPLPDTTPGMVVEVVQRLLRKRPDERFASAGELEQALEECELALRTSGIPAGSGMFPPVVLSGSNLVPVARHSGTSGQAGVSSGQSLRAIPAEPAPTPSSSFPVTRSGPSSPALPALGKAPPPSRTLSRMLLGTLFLLTMSGSAVLFYGLRHYLPLQRAVSEWVPSFKVPQDEEVEMTLRALAGERDRRQWPAVLRGVQFLEQRYGRTLLPEQQKTLTVLHSKALLEQRMQELYDKLVVAATRPDSEEVMRLYGQMSGESLYRPMAQQYYDAAVESYVAMHLSKAEALRLAGKCQEYLTEVQTLINTLPGHPQARAAELKDCPPPPLPDISPAPEAAPIGKVPKPAKLQKR
jgi:serine/threonine-protein kinase